MGEDGRGPPGVASAAPPPCHPLSRGKSMACVVLLAERVSHSVVLCGDHLSLQAGRGRGRYQVWGEQGRGATARASGGRWAGRGRLPWRRAQDAACFGRTRAPSRAPASPASVRLQKVSPGAPSRFTPALLQGGLGVGGQGGGPRLRHPAGAGMTGGPVAFPPPSVSVVSERGVRARELPARGCGWRLVWLERLVGLLAELRCGCAEL